jgi:MtrB/PioB family decaheme-associated outer membrane protein
MIKKCLFTIIAFSLSITVLSSIGIGAQITKLNNIRFGQHNGYTRLVLDSEGARPLEIGPATAESLKITYNQLELERSVAAKFRGMNGTVDSISHHREGDHSVITVTFGRTNTAVKSFFMQGESSGGGYRLILDLYPPESPLTGPGSLVPIAVAGTESAASAAASASKQTPARVQTAPSAPSAGSEKQPSTAADVKTAASARQAAGSAAENQEAEPGESIWHKFSGEISVIGRLRNDDAKSDSLYLQYRDVNSITGDYDIKYVEPDQYYFQTDGKNLGQDDVNLNFRGGRFGILKGSITYDEIPHRFAFDVKTLYSGVGSDTLTLNNTLQTTLQGLAGDPAAQADALKDAYGSADTGDPEIKRKKLSGDIDFVALDPFSFRAEFSREKQDGSRPFFGSFSLDNTVELFEPIDNETWAIKLIAEYAKKAYLLNTTYFYQHFTNNEDTLTFDNPFRVNDTVGGPARGQIDLAPDNHYQNLSMSGSYNELPLRSRLAASIAWGWMRQGDDLPAFTTNTALVAPINYSDRANLPEGEADVKVDTTLFDAMLTSRPMDFMHLNAKFRYYNYDNKTDKIYFPNGYVETDSFAETPLLGYPISTLPSSYEKTKADLNLGFDVWTRTRLNLDYSYNRTDRDNREVDKQTSNIFGGSIDSGPVDWGDLKLSYKRTETDIDNYDYNEYLKSGQDLQQLPGLRKYTQADVNIDRIQLMANVYPIDPLVFSSSFVYGKHNYDNSSFGLTEADYYSYSIDGDYTLTDKLQLNAFYIYEKYKNKQKAQGEFDEDGDGITTLTVWKAEGTDDVHTFGGGLTWTIMPERLDFKLKYSYSKVDGKIDFSVPSGTVTSFDEVGDSTLQTLDAKLKYNIWGGYYITFGYIWEKFDYDDYNKDGFTNVPTDASGNFNGAILADSLWDDYAAQILYLKLSYNF